MPMPDAPPAPGFLSRLLSLRREELAPAFCGAAFHFCLLAAYYILRPLREEIGSEHREYLSLMWTLGAVVTLPLIPLYSWVTARWPRGVFLPWVYRGCALLTGGFYLALSFLPAAQTKWVELAFYVWVSAFVLIGVTVFWAFMADLFPPARAKRMFGLLAFGGSLGGVAGPVLTTLLAQPIGRANLLLISIGLLELSVWALRATEAAARPLQDAPADAGGPATESQALGGTAWSGITSLFRSPYMLAICAYILLFVFGSGFLYFFQAELAREAFPDDRDARTAFFSSVDLMVNSATLVLLFLLTGRVMQRIGVGWVLTILPLLSVAGFALLAASPTLGVLVLFLVLRRTANFAFSRPAREVLYTVVGREQRYKTKAFIDTFVYRGGDVATAWIYEGLAALGMGLASLSLLAVPVAALFALQGLALGRAQKRREVSRAA